MLEERDSKRRNRTLWCAGLPQVSERRLDRAEQEQLRLTAWRFLRQGLGAFLGVAVLGIGLIVGAAELDKYWGGSLVVITVLFIVLLLSLPAILFAREGWTQQGFLTFRDLHRGYVRVFAGELTQTDLLKTDEAADATQRCLISLELLTLDTLGLQTIEVLPISRWILRVNEETIEPWVEAIWKEVSSAPEAARPWLHAGSPLTSEDGKHSRRLSNGELAELRREARRLWLGPFVVALLMTIWLLVIVFLALTAGGVPKAANWWNAIHIALAAFAADTYFLNRWREAQKLYQDIRSGEARVEFNGSFPGKDQTVLLTETLPNSRRLWTQSGRPAAWRRIGR